MDTVQYIVNERRGTLRVVLAKALCDAIEFADSPTPSHNAAERRTLRDSDSWAYGALRNAEGYRAAVNAGWDAAVKRIEELQGKIGDNMATPLDLRRKPTRGSSGDEYCIHAARAGRSDKAWSARRKTLTKARAPLRLIVDCTANATVDDAAFFWRGAAALALAQPLIAKGYKVAITALVGTKRSYHDGAGFLGAIDVKGYGERLDVPRLAALLCSCATLRHLGFRMMMNVPETIRDDFGQAMYGDEILRRSVEAKIYGNTPEERMLLPDLFSETRCVEWLKKTGAQFAA